MRLISLRFIHCSIAHIDYTERFYGIKCSNVSINFCMLKNGSAFNVQCDVFMSERTVLYPLNRSPVFRERALCNVFSRLKHSAMILANGRSNITGHTN